jgi:hypothetical protein
MKVLLLDTNVVSILFQRNYLRTNRASEGLRPFARSQAGCQ